MLQIWEMANYLLNSPYSKKILGHSIEKTELWQNELRTFWEKFKVDTCICAWRILFYGFLYFLFLVKGFL